MRVISTVQVGITAIGILTGAVGEPLVRDLLAAVRHHREHVHPPAALELPDMTTGSAP